MSSSKRDFDKTEYIYFGEKWRIAWKINEFEIKSATLLKRNLIVNLLNIKKYLRTKIKSYKGKTSTHW